MICRMMTVNLTRNLAVKFGHRMMTVNLGTNVLLRGASFELGAWVVLHPDDVGFRVQGGAIGAWPGAGCRVGAWPGIVDTAVHVQLWFPPWLGPRCSRA